MNRGPRKPAIALICLGAYALFGFCSISTASAAEAAPPMPAPLSAAELAQEVEAAVAVTPEVVVPAPPPSAPAPAASFSQGGVLGTVNAGLVNIRSGPGSEADTEYEIVTTLKRGTEVTILGKRDDWYCIAWPQGHPCYLSANRIDGQVPSVVDPRGVSVPVKGPKTNLYVRPWEKSTIVGTLEGGDIVTVIGRRGEMYKIAAPPVARAWVSAKYVDLASDVALSQASAPKPGVITKSKKSAKKAAAKKAKTSEIIRLHRKKLPAPEVLQRQAEERRQRYLQSIENELAKIRAETNKQKEEINLRYSSSRAAPAAGKAAASPAILNEGDFTGWIEHIGYAVKRPAAYRLVKGGDVIFLLRSAAYNLEKYVNCRVAVNGRVELAPGFSANVLVVDKLKLLDPGPLQQPPGKVKKATGTAPEAAASAPQPPMPEEGMALPTATPLGEIVDVSPAE